MPNNWAEWDAAHGHGEGRTRSADKLAATIKSALGSTGSKGAPVHGSHGTSVHKTTKKDLKRPAPVKGEKDAADSMRTRIRMAEYNRKKTGETVAQHIDRFTPKTEQKVNPHEAAAAQHRAAPEDAKRRYAEASDKAWPMSRNARTAAADRKAAAAHREAAGLATNDVSRKAHLSQAADHERRAADREYKAAARSAEKLVADRNSRYETARHEAYQATRAADSGQADPAKDRAAAEAHRRAADLAPDDQKQRAHDTQARVHRQQAKQVESARADTLAQHNQLANISDRANGASAKAERENTKENHQAASDLHQQAADLANRMGQTQMAQHHQNLAGLHQMVADGPRKRTGRAGDRSMEKGGSARSADKIAAGVTSKPRATTPSNVSKDLAAAGHQKYAKPSTKMDARGNILQSSGDYRGYQVRAMQSAAGPRVEVMLHGSSVEQSNMDKVQRDLEAAGHRVVHRGYGRFELDASPRA